MYLQGDGTVIKTTTSRDEDIRGRLNILWKCACELAVVVRGRVVADRDGDAIVVALVHVRMQTLKRADFSVPSIVQPLRLPSHKRLSTILAAQREDMQQAVKAARFQKCSKAHVCVAV